LDRFNRADAKRLAIKGNTLLPVNWILALTGANPSALRFRVRSKGEETSLSIYPDKIQRQHDTSLTHSTCCLSVKQVENQHHGFGIPFPKPKRKNNQEEDPNHTQKPPKVPLYALNFKNPDSPNGFRAFGRQYVLPRYFVHTYDSENEKLTGQIERLQHTGNVPATTPWTDNKVFTLDYYHCEDWEKLAIPDGYSLDGERGNYGLSDSERSEDYALERGEETSKSAYVSPFNHISLDTLDVAIACLAYRVVAVIFTQDLTEDDIRKLSEMLDNINEANGIAILVTSADPIDAFRPLVTNDDSEYED
jgi:hypothetical protein